MRDKNPITEEFRPHVEGLKRDAALGSRTAKRAIEYYQMHVACPSDPGAQGFALTALSDWKATK